MMSGGASFEMDSFNHFQKLSNLFVFTIALSPIQTIFKEKVLLVITRLKTLHNYAFKNRTKQTVGILKDKRNHNTFQLR